MVSKTMDTIEAATNRRISVVIEVTNTMETVTLMATITIISLMDTSIAARSLVVKNKRIMEMVKSLTSKTTIITTTSRT